MAGSHKASRRGVAGRAHARRRRRRPSRIVAASISGTLLLTSAAGCAYLRLSGSISTFGSDGLSEHRPEESAGGQNVLIIGSDSRGGENSELGGGEGDVGRSDTALLLHVYNDKKHAVAVSVPRDALVKIPSCKKPDGSWTEPRKQATFNEAFAVGQAPEGNPACTQNTVEELSGLRVDHTVVVDFTGFSALTEAVGGVQVCVPNDVYQKDLDPGRSQRGSLLFARGKHTVSGQQALDYVRLRHGIGDGSDIGRIQRQQAFVGSLVKKIKSQGVDPQTLMPLAKVATESLTVDEGLGSVRKMSAFALQLKDIDLDNTAFVTLPWRYRGARVAVVESEADRLWAALKADRPLDGEAESGESGGGKREDGKKRESGSGIEVSVRNGTTVSGLGARATEALERHDFTVTGTATAHSQDVETTRIAYDADREADAKVLAGYFPGARLTQSASGGVEVVLGRDHAERVADSGSADEKKPRTAGDDICSDLSYG